MKSKKNRILRYITICLCAIQLLMLSSVVWASESQEKGEIHFTFENMAGVEIHMYRVGSAVQSGIYQLEGAFRKYSIDLNEKSAALTLDSYIQADAIPTDYRVCVDEAYVAEFTDLAKGVYLIRGGRYESSDMTYTWNPILLELPQWDENKQLVWKLEIQGKVEVDEKVPSVDIEVLKVWKNDDKENRPDSIKVALTCDGKVESEMVLSNENNWTFRWEGLSGDSDWKVVERDVPTGYTVSLDRYEEKVIITNTKTPEKPSEPSKPTEPTNPSKPSELPKTGQLWWPVMILVSLGLLCLIIGVRLIR